MLYDYRCKKCQEEFEVDFRIGQAEAVVPCPKCQSDSKRAYTSCNFSVDGPSKMNSFNKEMTERNEKAGRRMKKEHGDGPVRLVAHDYGNGDVREVKKGKK